MDKIKTVKIKNSDGSISEETYTISVDAKDVDMNNGKDLQDIIGNIDVDKDGSIADQFKKYKNYDEDIENLYTDISNLESKDRKLEEDILALQIENIKKKAYYYNSIADMKADTKLKAGDMAVTLGYYEPNDGGGAEYRIVSGFYTDDGGSYHQLDNNLFAELIIRDNLINVKQFGAYGDGQNDDTEKIQKLINLFKDKINQTRNIANNNVVWLPAGEYKITSTIIIPTFIKIKTSGYVGLLSYISNGPCLHFTPVQYDVIESIGTNQNHLRAPWVDGEAGLILKYMGSERNNSIGIEVGSQTDLGAGYQSSKFSMKNIHIYNFHIGLLLNTYHLYCTSFYEFNIIKNDICVQIGHINAGSRDSGERINFTDCVFSDAMVNIQWEVPGMGPYFINCSFDYSKCIFNFNNTKQHSVDCVACHFEGMSTQVGQGEAFGIAYGEMTNPNKARGALKLTNCSWYITNENLLFSNGASSYDLYLNNIQISYGFHSTDGNLPFWCDDTIDIGEYSGLNYSFLVGKLISSKFNILPQSSFNDCATGKLDASSSLKIGSWNINNSTNVDLTNFVISTDNPISEKSLNVTPLDPTENYNLILESDYINVLSNKRIAINYITQNLSAGYTSKIFFYDKNYMLLGSDNASHWTPDYGTESIDKWFLTSNAKVSHIIRNVAYIKINNKFSFISNKIGKIGGLFCVYL